MKHTDQRKEVSWWYVGIVIAIVLLIAGIAPSDASGADKIYFEGYYGPQRIQLSEKAVSPNSGDTTIKGWIGGDRVDLRRIQHPNGTTTVRGWHGDNYIRGKTEVEMIQDLKEASLEHEKH